MRIRLYFSKNEKMRFTGHLDLHRAWERTFRRAGLPLAYSEGYNPRPKINLASALPLGYTSNAEVLDVLLTQELSLAEIKSRIQDALPPGIDLTGLEQVSKDVPALQAELVASEYLIIFLDPYPSLDEDLMRITSQETLLRQRRGKEYDLRPLIEEVHKLERDDNGYQRISVRLSAREGATGRPDEVVSAFGYDPLATRIHRTRLIFEN